jgi:hypothetical protein
VDVASHDRERIDESMLWVVVLGEEEIIDALDGSGVFYFGGPMEDQIVGFGTR